MRLLAICAVVLAFNTVNGLGAVVVLEPTVHGRYADPAGSSFTAGVRFTTDPTISALSGVPIGNGGNHLTGALVRHPDGIETEFELRNYFVFDLAGIEDTVTSAAMWLGIPKNGSRSSDPTETFQLFHVSSPLLPDGTLGGTSQFDDLADGNLYGTAVLSSADDESNVAIVLTREALDDMNAFGGSFKLGAAVTSLDNTGVGDEFVFGSTWARFIRQLVVATGGDDLPEVPPFPEVPEPCGFISSGILIVISLLGFGRRREI